MKRYSQKPIGKLKRNARKTQMIQKKAGRGSRRKNKQRQQT
jgi:hypothetical protein